jgi:hypothetical protein
MATTGHLAALLPMLLLGCSAPDSPQQATIPKPSMEGSIAFASTEHVDGLPVDSVAVATYLQRWNGDVDDATAFLSF